MRHNSRGLIVVVCALLTAVASESKTSGEEVATLVFRTAALPQPVVQASATEVEYAAPAPPELPPPPPAAYPEIAPKQTAPRQPVAPAATPRFPSVGSHPIPQSAARGSLSQTPRRPPIQPSAQRSIGRTPKPFEVVYQEPTVSPYLNLYRDELDEESAPNYFAFVRPQMEQLDANRQQQREIQKLRGQLNGMSATVVGPRYEPTGRSTTGAAARYMDTAQFYGAWQR